MLLEVQLLEESVHKLSHHGNDNQVCVGLLIAAGRAALDFEGILETHPQNMSIDSRQQLLAAYSNHVELFERAGARLSPKNHLLLHGVLLTRKSGNMRFYHCYRDESSDGVLAVVARSCHRRSFAYLTHQKFEVMQQLQMRQACT